MSRLREAALAAAANGCRVFPCRADKRPLTAHGFKDATTNPETVWSWWTQNPDAFIGLATGSGLVVIDSDIDPAKGLNGENDLKNFPPLPATYTVQTPRGGRHRYFSVPEGEAIPCSAGKLACGVDVRGDGGYVIMPPSGHNGTAYAVFDDSPIAVLPREWLELLRKKEKPPDLPMPSPHTSTVSHDLPPWEDFARRTSWAQILEPQGWKLERVAGDGNTHWTRPGKDEGTSATTKGENGPMYVFSGNAGLPQGQGMSKAFVHAFYRHGGDMSAAAKALREMGYGTQPALDISNHRAPPAAEDEFLPPAATLPQSVDVTLWVCEELPAPDPVLMDAFDLGTKALVVGPSKSRKSFFLLQMLLSIAAGLPTFLTWNVTKARRVLLLNLEIPPAHFQARLRRMMTALGITPEMLGGRLHIINARGMEPSITLLPQIVERVKEHGTELVGVDPIYKLIPGDESKQEDVKPLLRMFDQLANQTNVAVAYCHHSQKGIAGDRLAIDRASGTGVMARDFDWMASLCHHQAHKETGLLVCEQIARSYPPKDAFSLAWDTAGYFKASEEPPVVLTSRNADKTGRAGRVLTADDAYLMAVQKGAMKSTLLQTELQKRGFTQDGARNAVDELVQAERLVRHVHGFPRSVYVGTPSAVASLLHKLQNPGLPGVKS